MVRFLVEKGIDSISVNADAAKEISDYVAEVEKEMGEGQRQYSPLKKDKEEPSINGIVKKEDEEKPEEDEDKEMFGFFF
jgi:hypothetical protein